MKSLLEMKNSDISHSQLKTLIRLIEMRVKSGKEKASKFKGISSWCKNLAKKIDDSPVIKDELENEIQGGQEITINGFRFKKEKSGVKYTFENSPAYKHFEELAKPYIDQMNEIKKTARKLSDGQSAIHELENGEKLEIFPAVERSGTTIKTYLPK